MTASVEFLLGGESVTVPLSINLDTETIITGDFGGVVPAGTTARLRGNVRLIDNLHVRGTLLCDPTGVDLDGQNLFDIHTHDGTLNLVGQEKTAWCHWGDNPVGWQIGDRLAIAPTAVGVYVPSEGLWTGDWDTMIRPANSPNVNLPPNPYLAVARPEVANLSQKVTLRNLKRIMVHEASAPNPQTLKWIKVLNSGEANVLGMYPIHFHMIGEHARGSLLEGVVVEGGKNHAVVPHASHGITIRDVVAYNTINLDPFWWDEPATPEDVTNNSNDIAFEHILGMWVKGTSATRTAAALGAGSGNSMVDSAMTCVQGGQNAAGYQWPSKANQNPGGNMWTPFARDISHNNKNDGIFVWQNDPRLHVIEDFFAYRNGAVQIDHGAYGNHYTYRRMVLMGGTAAFQLHAQGPILLEDIIADGPLVIAKHTTPAEEFATVRRCQFTKINYREFQGTSPNRRSMIRYEDCGLEPTDFDLLEIVADSIIEITEGGVLTYRWAGGWV